MTLSNIDFINGLFALIYAVVTIVIGVKISLKYFEFKHKTYLYIGIGWAGLSCGWWGSGFGFLFYLITNILFDDVFYIFVTVFFITLFTYLLFYGLSELVWEGKKKLIFRLILFVIDVIFQIYLVVFFIVDPSQIATKTGTFDITLGRIATIYLLIDILFIISAGLTFSYKGIKSDDPELKLKGKILMIAFILYPVGVILDSMLVLTELTLIITRSLLMMCSILFYIGYLLPEWIKKILLKNN
jgi:hypothetical protein